MEFYEVIKNRESTRAYAGTEIENEKLERILEAARLSPSACNGQPYLITVVKGEKKNSVAKKCADIGINGFAKDAPVLLVISEMPYNKSALLGSKLKGNDYRSLDIGIAIMSITLAATEEGLGSCILGWFDDKKIREICSLEGKVRAVITLGYKKNSTEPREKKRKSPKELFKFISDGE